MLLLAVLLGAVDPACTKDLICQDHYTSTVRPSARYTNVLKRKQLTQRNGSLSELSEYEEDHFIPLELCGDPRNPANLWPQRWPEAREKDKDETRLHRAVCKNQISLKDAQDQIRQHWTIH